MGTTVVALMHADDQVALTNIGDSRAYLLRKDDGFLDGRQDGRSPDITRLHLNPGDRILLCSDGLSSYVPAEAIRRRHSPNTRRRRYALTALSLSRWTAEVRTT